MEVYKGLTQEELEAQYFLRATRPGYEENDIPRWLAKSRRFVESVCDARLDLAYGPTARNRLDLFPAPGKCRGLLLYIHGGYWQRGDKSVYSFIAEPFLHKGFSVALMNYQMCPEVRLSDIAPQARQAITWLWRNAGELGLPNHNFNVMGHSAGGHLTAEMLLTNWPAVDTGLPREFLNAAVAVSGIYDFEPILYCSENEGLRLDAKEARRVSPIYRKPALDIPHLVAYGSNEPTEMRRQSEAYVNVMSAHFSTLELLALPQADHFETVDVLADKDSELFMRTINLFSN